MKNSTLGLAAMAALVGTFTGTGVSFAKSGLPVVAEAQKLTVSEKANVNGECGCSTPAPTDTKPGYGFGTTGHYGPPGQGFTPSNSWRQAVAAGQTTTPIGNPLPPRAFR
jgi:hypothetical protein